MGKRERSILEMIYHINRMTDSEKVAFVQFISKYRSSRSLANMFKAFDNAKVDEVPKGLLRRIMHDQNGNAYKNFHRFKKKLFEFELSSKRLDYFKRYDPHRFNFMNLKKEILASEMLTERNAYHTSIQLLKDTLKKSIQYEYSSLEKDCLRDLEQFCKHSGQGRLEKKYAEQHKEVAIRNDQFEKIQKSFEQQAFGMRCCAFHKNKVKQDAWQDHHNYFKKWKSKNALWMASFLKAKALNEENKFKESLFATNSIKRELNLQPGLYPATFRLSAHMLILENLWYLKKFVLIEKYSRKLLHLDNFSNYQRIPMLQYFLHYFLWMFNYDMIELILSDLVHDISYRHFKSFQMRAKVVEVASFFLQEKYQECLSIINRNPWTDDSDCENVNLDMRYLELLSLFNLKEDLLLEDRLSSLRKHISRNPSLKNDEFALHFIRVLKRKQLDESQDLMLYHSILSQRSIFDIRWLFIQEVIRNFSPNTLIHFGKYSSQYKFTSSNISYAAEKNEHAQGFMSVRI